MPQIGAMTLMTSSPYATGGGGVDLETEVVAYYLATVLTRATPRGLRDAGAAAHTVTVQTAARGEPLDDIVVRASRSGGDAKLSLQVKRSVSFTESDDDFRDVVQRAWMTVSAAGFQPGVDGAGLAVGVYQTAIDEHYDRTLQWARTSSAADDFVGRIGLASFAHDRQRKFVRTIRTILSNSLHQPASDDDVWRFCRSFVILHFDFQTIGSRDVALTESVLRASLDSNDGSRVTDLRNELIEVAKNLKHSGGSATTDSLRTRVAGRFTLRERNLQNLAALELLRNASYAAAMNAGIVDAGARNVRLGDGLYAERDVEPKLRAAIETGGSILLIGEAGQGKTTLLWHAWETLSTSPAHEAWLIKPTRLFSGPSPLTEETFEQASEAARAQGRAPIALLDTVDVLTHDDYTFEKLIELLAGSGSRYAVVASTRPFEATILRQSRIPFVEIFLGNYDEESGELKRAIGTHVRSFYGDYDPERDSHYVAHILNAVAAGLPLRQVCLNPLTLRMLFVLYAPSEIPEQIHVVELFREFWRRRVESDTRPGLAVPVDTRSLASVAEAVALTMLMEGAPEIEATVVESILSRLGESADDIEALTRRGVLVRSSSRISFFHQTFFEHAAARLVARSGERLRALRDRVRSRGHDPFLSPILEQALLLASFDPLVRDASDAILLELLTGNDIAELRSGLSVFILRESVPAAVADRVRKIVEDATYEAASTSLFSAAANAPASRPDEVLELVAFAWKAGASWRIRQKTFVLLERLAGRCSARVRECLERIDGVHYALTESISLQPESELRDVMRALAPYEPDWVWNAAVRLYEAAGTRSDGLRVKMVRLIADRAESFGVASIATRFENAVESGPRDPDRDDRTDFHEAWARLWSIEWSDGRDIAGIVRSIPADRESVRGRVFALSNVLMHRSLDDVRRVWEFVIADDEPSRQSLMLMHVWTPFLLGTAPEELCEFVRERFANALAGASPARQLLLANAISHSGAPPAVVARIFSASEFDDPEPWLDRSRIARVAGAASVGGHPGAANAIARIAASPAEHRDVAELLIRTHSGHALDAASAHLFATVAAPAGVASTVSFAERLDDRSLALLAAEPGFMELISTWRVDRSGNTRRDATRLLSLVVAHTEVAPPPLDQLLNEVESEHDPAHAGHIAILIGCGAKRGGYDMGRVLGALRPLVTGHERTRTNALAGLMTAIGGNPAADPYLEAVLDLVMQPPTDQGRLRSAHDLLLRLVQINPRRAVERFRDLLTSEAVHSLGVNAKRDLRTALATPARVVIAAATRSERVAMIRELPTLDRFLAPIVVTPLCEMAYADVDALAGEVSLYADADVQILLRQGLKRLKREYGSGRWPEVWEVVSATA